MHKSFPAGIEPTFKV